MLARLWSGKFFSFDPKIEVMKSYCILIRNWAKIFFENKNPTSLRAEEGGGWGLN